MEYLFNLFYFFLTSAAVYLFIVLKYTEIYADYTRISKLRHPSARNPVGRMKDARCFGAGPLAQEASWPRWPRGYQDPEGGGEGSAT